MFLVRSYEAECVDRQQGACDDVSGPTMLTTDSLIRIVIVFTSVMIGLLMVAGFGSDVWYLVEWEGYSLLGAVAVMALWLIMAGDTTGIKQPMEKLVDRYVTHLTRTAAKREAVYGDPNDTTYFTSDDRPIPESLRYRVAIYTARREKEDPEDFQNELEAASSFNALVRKEARAGRL